MLPGVKIEFRNDSLGQVASTKDGCFGLIASAIGIEKRFELDSPYQIKSMKDVAQLGIDPSGANKKLYKTLKEFYTEAGEGTELWLLGVNKDTKLSDFFAEKNGVAIAETLLNTAQGKITALFTSYDPSEKVVVTVEKGLDKEVSLSITQAQKLAEKVTVKKYAPFFTMLEGYAFDGDKVKLANLLEQNDNRVGVLIGDSEKGSKGAAVGVVMGRLAKVGVHVNMGRVRDGAIAPKEMFIGEVTLDQYDVEALHDKGYNSFRFHQGKSGYYMIDDLLATSEKDDFRFISRRRVIDKAYRVVYSTMLDFLLDNSMVMPNGEISPVYARTIENTVEGAIYQAMTINGELSVDSGNPNDRGVICSVDTKANVVSTGQLKLSVQVRPLGYNRFIDVELGYVPVKIN